MPVSISTTIPHGFWPQIKHQLDRIVAEKPSTFDDVRAILNDPAYTALEPKESPNSAFFSGSGGDDTLYEALRLAGWQVRLYKATYHYVMSNLLSNETLTYTEGDVERGNQILP